MTENNNSELVSSLREAAAYLEEHKLVQLNGSKFTDYPLHCNLRAYCKTAEELIEVARGLGSFTKEWNEGDLQLIAKIAPLCTLTIAINREELGCKKTVTWECPDGLESLLDPMHSTKESS